MESKLRRVFAEAFEMDEGEIFDDSSPETVVRWDSLNHLKMAMAMEAAFGVKLTMKEIRSMVTFARIREVLAVRAGRPGREPA